jgi:DNA-binding response OmpR family regulator
MHTARRQYWLINLRRPIERPGEVCQERSVASSPSKRTKSCSMADQQSGFWWGDCATVSGSHAAEASQALEFGPFRLFPRRGLLLEDDKECRLGSRAMDLLLALLERAGETVTKQELLDRVWPGIVVDDANLRVHVAALRKALGDGQGGTR